MPAHSRGTMKVEAWFGRILAALCQVNGGTLRIKGADFDSIDKEAVLVSDWDQATQELVLRLGTRFNDVYRVQPEEGSWQKTIPIATNPQPSLEQAKVAAASTTDDSRLVNLERQFLRQRVKTLLDLERRARAAEESR